MKQQINLHPTQENIFFDQLIDNRKPHYNVGGYLVLNGDLNEEKFEDVIKELPDFFDIYKIEVGIENDKPCLFIHDEPLSTTLCFLDLKKSENAVEKAKKWMQGRFDQAFEFSGQLHEQYIIRISDTQNYFFFRYHHMLMDGLASTLYTKHIFEEYNLKTGGEVEEKREPYPSFINEVIKSQEYLSSEKYLANKEYWNAQFLTYKADPLLHKRYDYNEDTVLNAGTVTKVIDQNLFAELQGICRTNRCSLQQLTIAALAIYYNRIENQNEFVFGVPTFNRNKEQLKITGTFANVLALHIDFNEELSVGAFITEIRVKQLGSYRHMNYPLRHLNNDFKLLPNGRRQLFDITVDYSLFKFDVTFNGTTPLIVDIHSNYSDLPLQVTWKDFGDQQSMIFQADYQFEYFNVLEAERIIERIIHIIRQFSTPEFLLKDISILPIAEEKLLTNLNNVIPGAMNSPAIDLGVAQPINVIFDQQAEIFPDLVAIKHNDLSLTYRELSSFSNKISRQFYQIKKQSLIAVYMHRSSDVIAAFLGILKAGNVYVPLDTQNPPYRTVNLIKEGQIEVLVTHSALLEELINILIPETLKTIICIDHASVIQKKILADSGIKLIDAAEIDISDNLPVVNFNQLSSWAYMLYTSGSTGSPKGAITRHDGALNHIFAEIEMLGLKEGFKFLQSASIASDISVWQMLAPLCKGGTVVIIDKDDLLDYDKVYQTLSDNAVNIVEFVPSYLIGLCNYFMNFPQPPGLNSLEWIMMVGEEVPVSLVNDWLMVFPSCKVLNGYGPCEASDDITQYSILTQLPVNTKKVPIGRPIHNMNVFILDKKEQLLPIGEAGELCVSGIGVGAGYWQMPEKTAEKFIENPFNHMLGDVLYKTGDMARWNVNGELEFLGRKDDQLKIRGFRVELGEIENILNIHPYVKEATTAIKQVSNGSNLLIGYIIVNDNLKDSQLQIKKTLSSYLTARLPLYMVPSELIFLDQFPYNLSDKIDKKRLPDPEGLQQDTSRYEAPQTFAEKMLVEIWQELFKRDKIGIHDNFFELGGDSIITIQVVSRARRAGLILQPRDVFRYQNIADLALELSKNEKVPVLVKEQGPLSGQSGLLPIQHWFFEQQFVDPDYYNQQVMLSIAKDVSEATLIAACAYLNSCHDGLRFNYTHNGQGWEQSYTGDGLTFARETVVVEDLSSAISEICASYQGLVRIDSGFIGYMVLIETPEQESMNRLFIVLHHLVMDGVSWRILLEDLSVYLSDATVAVHKTSSYGQWHEKLQEYAVSDRVQAHRDYWRNAVSRARPYQTDHQVNGTELSSYTVSLDASLTRQLLQECSGAYHTEINDLLLSALACSLGSWQDRSEIVIGMEGHGREDIAADVDVSHTTGWFTSLYPVMLDITGVESTGELIKTVKEQLREVPDKGLSYGVLRYLHPLTEVREELASSCVFDVVFNYLGQLDSLSDTNAFLKDSGYGLPDSSSKRNIQPHKVEINGYIIDNQINFNWRYLESEFERNSIIEVSLAFIENLNKISKHCIDQKISVKTPSDYNIQRIASYHDLDNFFNGYNKQINIKNIAAIYELSAIQEGMLFHSIYNENSQAYFEQLNLDLKGKLRTDEFERSWNMVLQKHSILRSSFHYKEFSVPVQCVHHQASIPFKLIDLTHLDEDEQTGSILHFLNSDRNEEFDFTKPPLIRIGLLKLSEVYYKLICTGHHILTDGWSMPIMFKEVLSYYHDLINNNEVIIGIEDKYQDYINYIVNKNINLEKDFWKKYLGEDLSGTLLPFVKSTAARNRANGIYKNINLEIDEIMLNDLDRFKKAQHLTLSVIIQGVWSFLLSRYTGKTEVIHGFTVSGRPVDLDNIENRVGLYINSIPVKAVVDEVQCIKDFLSRLSENLINLKNYETTALTDINKWLNVSGELFDSVIVFKNYPFEEPVEGENTIRFENLNLVEQNNYVFTLYVTESVDELSITFSYNSDLLNNQYANQISKHFQKVLQHFIYNSDSNLECIDYLTQEEHSFYKPDTYENKSLEFDTVDQLITKLSTEIADKTAVKKGDESITYGELVKEANSIANFLSAEINDPDEIIVGLLLDRSVQMIQSIVGIWKAGYSYLPISPSLPITRIETIIKDSGLRILFYEKKYKYVALQLLNNCQGLIHIVCIDEITETENYPEELYSSDRIDVENQLSGLNWNYLSGKNSGKYSCLHFNSYSTTRLAYIIYTSGSTGTPKGVMVEHRGMLNHLYAKVEDLDINAASLVAQNASQSFDISVWQMFAALIIGGTTVIYDDQIILDTKKFIERVAADEITVLEVVPSYLAVLLEEENLRKQGNYFPLLTCLVVTGEAVSPGLVSRWFDRFPEIKLVNAYGPTEASDDITHHIMTEPTNEIIVPVGKPIRGFNIYVVDKNQNLCPIGVKGEIWVSGIGIGRGYLNSPEKTAIVFIQDPFREDKIVRLYKTGDMGRYLPDGTLEFLGRQDNQIKIRGHRIELDEIANQILKIDGVKEAVVLHVEFKKSPHLIAFITLENPSLMITTEEIKKNLYLCLPEYMVPSHVVLLQEMPLTSNGKIDKSQLSVPSMEFLLQDSYEAPRTADEYKFAEIWQDLLGVSRVGIHDNFFELGGHSLLAIRLISAIRKSFSIELSVKAVFEYPQLKSMFAYLQQQGSVNVLPSISRAEQRDRFPLSYSQESLWFIDKLGGSGQYHMPSVLELKGLIDRNALSVSLSALVNRHEILRTVIKDEDGIGYQEVLASAAWQMSYSEQSFTDELAESAYIREYMERSFDLAAEPMFRVELLKTSSERYLLLVLLHHIVSDGWSFSILIGELSALYRAAISGHGDGLEELTVQYGDYASWQREQLSGSKLTVQQEYWQQKLAGVSPLELPLDYARPAVQSTGGDCVLSRIGVAESLALNNLCKEEGVTLYMVLLGVFNVLLYRYSGQTDICVGTSTAGRFQKELEGLIGYFVNTLVTRSDLEGNPEFGDHLQALKGTLLESYSHQEIPFEKVVEGLNQIRDLSRSPVFQVMFVLQNTPDKGELDLEGVSIKPVNVEVSKSKFDLTMHAEVDGDEIKLNIEYCSDLFSRETILQMSAHYHALLSSVLSDRRTRIGDLPMLSSSEEHQLLEDFQGAEVDYDCSSQTILNLFGAQVEKNGEAVAVVYEETSLTYLELDQHSNQLAHYLQSAGVGAGSLVGLCMERSVSMITGILGILKSGAAYVVIDPGYPAARIGHILDDMGTGVVVVGNEDQPDVLKAQLKTREGITFRAIESLGGYPQTAAGPQPKGDDLAYVIYTSGSTGIPKGVLIGHNQLMSYSCAIMDNLELSPGWSYATVSTFSADLGNTMIYPSLCSGGVLHILSEVRISHADLFGNYFKMHKIDCLKITPSHLMALLSGGTREVIPLQRLVLGGEASTWKLVEEISEINPGCRIYNHYGPTESTVGVVTLTIPLKSEERVNSTIKKYIPLGRPLNNVRLYVLDRNDRLVPAGVPGELYIGGVQVARGYLNLAEQTSDRFVEDVVAGCGRVYRTGDQVRWNRDGELEYLGRIDNQVKIRGYRIELGEIEAALLQVAGVTQSVVVCHQDEQGHKRLLGYVVCTAFNRELIHDQLRMQLPEYMVPAYLMALPSIPLTGNGKVDTKRLPGPEGLQQDASHYQAPRTVTEEKLTVIWQDLLGVPKIGIRDNFFELGGDSIITIQVVSRAHRAGLILQPRDIFSHQNIADLALELSKNEKVPVLVKEQGPLSGQSGLLPIQHYFFEQEYAVPDHYNQEVLLSIAKDVSEATLIAACAYLNSCHDGLRFNYTHNGQGWQQSYTGDGLTFAREAVVAENLSGAISGICASYQGLVRIGSGSIGYMVLIETPEQESMNRLFIVLHHLVVDWVSWRILLEDLSVYLSDATVAVHKTSSYGQWHEKLQEYAVSDRVQTHRDYWRNAVSRARPYQTDHQVNGTELSSYTVSLDASLTRQLLQECSGAYHTEINDLLLSALACSLGSWQDRSEIVIGMEGHGREDIAADVDVSHTTGWFTSLYPVMLDITGVESTGELIKTVKEQLREVPDKGLSYGVLRYLHPLTEVREELASSCVFDVVFNYLGQLDNVVKSDGVIGDAAEYCGPSSAAANINSRKLGITAVVADGCLKLQWSYAAQVYEQDTIEKLGWDFIDRITTIVAHCTTKEESSMTPSDYGINDIASYQELDDFLNNREETMRDIVSIYRLSPVQEGMLFHSLYDEESKAYLNQFQCDLIGDLSIEKLQESFDIILQKHTVLRSSFHYQGFSVPVQCVHRNVTLPFTVYDYTDELLTGGVEAFVEQDSGLAFNFSNAPVMRVSLLKLASDRYKLVWTSHHILKDGWSSGILYKELLSNYEELIKGAHVKSTEKDHYEDYIRYIEAVDKKSEEEYWKGHLAGFSGSSFLPFSDLKTGRNTGIGTYNSTQYDLEAELSAGLQQYGQVNHVTPSTILQGVWSYLLSVYTGQDDVVFGVTVSGRPADLSNGENRVGLFINTLPLRVKLNRDQHIAEWLQDVQLSHSLSREYQYTSLSQIKSWHGLQEDLFDSILVYENYPDNDQGVQSLKLEQLVTQEQTNYLLTLIAWGGENPGINFGYNSSMLSGDDVSRIRVHFEQILRQIIQGEATTLEMLNVLSIEQQRELLVDFQGVETTYDERLTILDFFEKQVKINGEAIAVVYEDTVLTYLELDIQSNRLGHCLRSNGIDTGSLVAICMERSLAMIISILGVLKSGAAYVPIDPNYPTERIGYLLDDIKAGLVLTAGEQEPALEEFLKNRTGLNVINITHSDAFSSYSETPVVSDLQSTDLAYVIYTSGSTGTPKGVMVEHNGLLNRLLWAQDYYQLTAEDRVLQKTTFCFDISVWELLWPLLAGCRLYFAIPDGHKDSVYLKNLIEQKGITTIHFVPSMLEVFLQDIESGDCRSLRRVLCSGEALRPHQASMFIEKLPEIPLYNLYGPTEASIEVTNYKVIPGADVLIGKPLSNVRLYVLDRNDRLVPAGVPGELYIGGVQVARGYLNLPEQTSDRFVEDVVAGCGRVYRTGDQVRWNRDGELEYLGRIDNQVKIRGYRIELGEIEAALLQVAGVTQSVVVCHQDEQGHKRLLGYVVCTAFNRELIQDQLRMQLPEYMVPAYLMALPSIPLTGNGKVDTKRLPGPEGLQQDASHYQAPRTVTEEKLTVIWQDLLGVPKVGIRDNFFRLGGDSLTILRLSSAIQSQFSVKIPVKILFQINQIADIAEYMEITCQKDLMTNDEAQFEVLDF